MNQRPRARAPSCDTSGPRMDAQERAVVHVLPDLCDGHKCAHNVQETVHTLSARNVLAACAQKRRARDVRCSALTAPHQHAHGTDGTET